MDDDLVLLKLLVDTSRSYYNTKISNSDRVRNNDGINELGKRYFDKYVIRPIDEPLAILRKEIIKVLNRSPIYLSFFKNTSLSIYDSGELIVLVGNIKRFENFDKFVAHTGMLPRKRRKRYNKDLHKLLIRISDKLLKDAKYQFIYEMAEEDYQSRNKDYEDSYLDSLAKRKVIRKFLKQLYNAYKEVYE